MHQDKLVIILADISGYTRFMLENRTSAVHGQLFINSLIEAILEQVDIPLTLQEIEGDAVFLYVRHPGSEDGWQAVLREVSQKFAKFFDAFIAQTAIAIESTPCGCAICRNADQLGLKIIVHGGEAVFHEVAGRPQVSGPDVILAHRLLKNSLQINEYLLLTEPAFRLLGTRLPGHFEEHAETYEGFGKVAVRVRSLGQDFLDARDAVYKLNKVELDRAVGSYTDWVERFLGPAAVQQSRAPIRPFDWSDRLLMLWGAMAFRLFGRRSHSAIPAAQLTRGKRRTEWTGRSATDSAASSANFLS
jgi:hypothetical protein